MPRYLSATDSFNSSGATIVPDSDLRSTSTSNRTDRNSRNPIPNRGSSRALMPADTLGRELDALIGGDDGMGMANFEQAMQDYRRLPLETQSQTDMREFITRSNPDLAAFLVNPSTNATDVLAQLQTQHLAELEQKRLAGNDQPHKPDPFRPSSSHSHRSSVSAHSFTTTEMGTDEAEDMDVLDVDPEGHINPNGLVEASPMALQTGLSWNMGDMAVDQTYPTPGPSIGGPSPPIATHSSRVRGPVGAVRGPGMDEEEARKRRLEHRRQINRKSAQKHRLRRKEETETLTKTIIDKDARIAQLEKDLAVEKSRTAQLQAFIDMQKGPRERDGRSERRW